MVQTTFSEPQPRVFQTFIASESNCSANEPRWVPLLACLALRKDRWVCHVSHPPNVGDRNPQLLDRVCYGLHRPAPGKLFTIRRRFRGFRFLPSEHHRYTAKKPQLPCPLPRGEYGARCLIRSVANKALESPEPPVWCAAQAQPPLAKLRPIPLAIRRRLRAPDRLR